MSLCLRHGKETRSDEAEALYGGGPMPGPLASVPPVRGWCNRQHGRFWPCYWGFESSPPSSLAHLEMLSPHELDGVERGRLALLRP
jgi:hypothetical protein